jgi:hypothetical protein
MSKFITSLKVEDITDSVWRLTAPLLYESDILGMITVPEGFYTDLASVPRIPLIYTLWGGRSHHEAVIHDYLYRIDSIPPATFDQANDVFLEAMEVRGKSWFVRKAMYWGVCVGGWTSYHKKGVGDKLC